MPRKIDFERLEDIFDDEEEDLDLDPMGVHELSHRSASIGAVAGAKTTGSRIRKVAGPAKVAFGLGNTVISQVGDVTSTAAKFGASASVAPIATSSVGGAVIGAAAAAAPVTGPVGLALAAITSTLSGISAVKTHVHISRIEQSYARWDGVASQASKDATLYVLVKKNKKRNRKGLGVVPVVGSTANTFYSIGRTIKKRTLGTRGEHRRSAAKTLWESQLAGCPLAREVCLELLGQKIFIEIQHERDGDLVIKKKMKSF